MKIQRFKSQYLQSMQAINLLESHKSIYTVHIWGRICIVHKKRIFHKEKRDNDNNNNNFLRQWHLQHRKQY